MYYSLPLILLCTVFTFLSGFNNSDANAAMIDRSVAVVDFTMTGQTGDEDWAAGLADFTLAILQEKGITSFERSRLRYLFEEYRLQEQGLTKPEQIVRKKLPWVRYLVNGSIARDNNTSFTLTLHLTDMQSGQDAGRYSSSGNYPSELARALTEVAMQTAEQVNSSVGMTPAPSQRQDRPGFTNSPEIALFYYKGLDHYLSGRPGYAEYYFRLAAHLDPSFFIASQWQARSYEQLGLNDFADLLTQQLQVRSANDPTLSSLTGQEQKTKGQLVVSIIPPSTAKEQNQLLEQFLRKTILADPTLQLFSHRTIASVAEEIDRGLSDSFNRHQLENQEWLSSDGLFSIGLKRGAGGEEKIRIRFIDSRSGRIVAEKIKEVGTKGPEETIWQLVREIRDNHIMVTTRGGNVNTGLRYTLTPFDRKEGQQNRWTPVEKEAHGIRLMADTPGDIKALFFYLNFMMGHDMVAKGHSSPYVELVLNRMEGLIDPNSDEAPFWLYGIQWKRIYLLWFNPWAQNKNGMIESRKDGALFEHWFGDLMNRYPDSLPSLLARYAVAMDKMYSGDAGGACSILEAIADKISLNPDLAQIHDPFSNRPPGSKQHEVATVLYFLTAKCALTIGQSDKAVAYATKARHSLERFYTSLGLAGTVNSPRIFPAIYGLYRFEDTWMLSPVPLPPDINVRDGFREEIDGIITQTQDGRDQQLTINQLRDRLNSQLPREEIVRMSTELLEMITVEIRSNKLHGYDFVSRGGARRLVSATREAELEQTNTILDNLIASYQVHYQQMGAVCPDGTGKCVKVDSQTGRKTSFPHTILAFDTLMLDLYLIGERLDLLDSLSRHLLQSRYGKRRVLGIRFQAWLLYETKSPQSSAEFLLKEVVRWERDFPETRNERYVELLSWCGQTLIDVGDGQRALQVYKRGVEQTPQLTEAKHCNDRELLGSLMFQQAMLEAKYNDRLSAVELLKVVIRLGENCEIYSLDRITERKKRKGSSYSTMPMFAGRNGMLEMAVEQIERLRKVSGE